MIFRARKSWRVLAAAGAAATPSFGVGTTRAAAAPVTTPPECGQTYDPSLHRLPVLDACGIKVSPFAGVTTLPSGGTSYSYRSVGGSLATVTVPQQP
jgi:hypothetical protein